MIAAPILFVTKASPEKIAALEIERCYERTEREARRKDECKSVVSVSNGNKFTRHFLKPA
jgi:hypothetical protein